ncbi:MAG: hypothetical protein ACTSQY_03255 [Candidatus Odinarchaeia archaeon]
MRYTNKELYFKLDEISKSINSLKIDQAVTTSKLKLQEKILYVLSTAIIVIFGWLVVN